MTTAFISARWLVVGLLNHDDPERPVLLTRMVEEQSERVDAEGLTAAAHASWYLVAAHVREKKLDRARATMDRVTALAGHEPQAAKSLIQGWNSLLGARWKSRDPTRLEALLGHLELLGDQYAGLASLRKTATDYRQYIEKQRQKAAKKR